MDEGLRRAPADVVLLTPAHVSGRFWAERELHVLLGTSTLIPVLNGVTLADLAENRGLLPDLAGLGTARNSAAVIARKTADAVLLESGSS